MISSFKLQFLIKIGHKSVIIGSFKDMMVLGQIILVMRMNLFISNRLMKVIIKYKGMGNTINSVKFMAEIKKITTRNTKIYNTRHGHFLPHKHMEEINL